MYQRENISKWNIKSLQHLAIQSACQNEEDSEDSSITLHVDVGVGVKVESLENEPYHRHGYLKLNVNGEDDNANGIFTILVEIKGTFVWQGVEEQVQELSNAEIIHELAPHGRETIYSVANKMGFSGVVIPLLQK